jgi:hypothetical protein
MRFLISVLALASIALLLLDGCAASDSAALAGGDAGTDADSDTDTGGVPIQHPEAVNPLLDPWGVMTGPISPPPENIYELGRPAGGDEEDDDLDTDGDPDAGVLDRVP